ncbi:glutathione S-transferase [Octadecabacter temperatus]|uniref:Tetrachloro-P-hydroquinone reductive dehalogenase n=1 Tax=Octadecabacter temperatus TaxID=1458307 RepID=A0A0K0Y8D4_9RHOB|nr:glutathione S-transferase family protein [Octadecabacter temperatus]AKS47180.1 Tetrachloro-P-hydroquinone reductive dehalogenase [Octadecabacter temperatus]SIO45633.1 glutathione S-transferase [Octadecabacter temperatus]
MPQIQTLNSTLTGLTELHLWHAPLSSCSQRVRLVLAELGRTYESHLVNLEAGEHATEEYQAIHPKGVVPALVDDGKLYIESVDIIQHLGGKNDDLMAADADLLALADGVQLDLKLLTFEFLFRGAPPADLDRGRAFQENHKNAWLRQFYLDFQAGFERDRVDFAVRRTDAALKVLEARLADGRPYLSGDVFSLSDIAWVPIIHRYGLMGWPYEAVPNLTSWFARVKARPSYDEALLSWQPKEVQNAFDDYTMKRCEEGTGIRAFGGL